MAVTVFFDIDSTLVENQFSRKVLGELLGHVAPFAQKTVMELGRELSKENTERQKIDPDHPLTMDWDDIAETIAKRYGTTLPDKVLTLWERYASADLVEVLDDAPSMLTVLREKGYRLVIATKGLKKYQDPVLNAVNLMPYFDDMLTPDLTGYLKTTPAYFNKYTSQPHDTSFIQVGDHYYDDVMCAVNNGFLSIMRAPIEDLESLDPLERPHYLHLHRQQISTYPKESTDILPNAVVVSLQEVPSVIERLLNV
jgi:putative hydrolase of the HAD superfamily